MAMTVGGPARGKTPVPYMNVTPLIDVVLVLLIIFMAMTPVASRRFWVHTPKQEKKEIAKQDLSPDPSPPLVLQIREDRSIHVNGVLLTPEELVPRLRRMFAARDDHVLFVDAADSVPVGLVVETLDRAREGGAVTIASLTKPLSGPSS
jgi:biopolymer transport protein ExbD/biopolymer transport protein TolR